MQDILFCWRILFCSHKLNDIQIQIDKTDRRRIISGDFPG